MGIIWDGANKKSIIRHKGVVIGEITEAEVKTSLAVADADLERALKTRIETEAAKTEARVIAVKVLDRSGARFKVASGPTDIALPPTWHSEKDPNG